MTNSAFEPTSKSKPASHAKGTTTKHDLKRHAVPTPPVAAAEPPVKTLAAIQKPMIISFEIWGIDIGPILHFASYSFSEQLVIQRMLEKGLTDYRVQSVMKDIRYYIYWLGEIRVHLLLPDILSYTKPKNCRNRKSEQQLEDDAALFGPYACSGLTKSLDKLRDKLADKGPSLLPHNIQALMRKHIPHEI